MNTEILKYLAQCPETIELMRELTPQEMGTLTVTDRQFDLGGEHIVRVNGEDFFSFEVWLGQIRNVKRLRAKPAPAPKPPAKKWEYFTSGPMFDKQLNDIGEEGWELVAVEGRGPENDARLYFKREKGN